MRKLSVVKENNIVATIRRIRSFGGGKTDAIKLPISIAIPAKEVTIPRIVSPPFSLGRIKAGSTASKADATKLTPDKNKINISTILFWFKHLSPDFTDSNNVSFFSVLDTFTDGICTNNNNAKMQ